MFKLIALFFLIISLSQAQTFDIAKFSIGESRIKVNQSDFEIKTHSPSIRVQFVQESVQWIRNESNLLVPRSLIAIGIKSDQPNIYLDYFSKRIIPVKKANYYYSEFFVDLFNPGEINVFQGNTLLDKVTIESKSTESAKSKQLIDYSCVPYNLTIEGIDAEYLSVGCKLERVGKILNEVPRLEVTISSTNLKTLNNERPPFTIYLTDNSPVEFNVLNSAGVIKTIKINAILPKRLTRLKTALGIGPYMYESSDVNANSKNELAPSFMIYGKLDLTENSSFKAFDAFVYSKSLFNNSGLYFSYDLAQIFDGRVILNALIGFQGLHYRYKKGASTEFRILYPQGFEFIHKHVFGLQNKNLTYGMFLSTSNSEPYTNAWIRFGGKIFWELNYISWSLGEKKISMTGFSVGFPFFEAF